MADDPPVDDAPPSDATPVRPDLSHGPDHAPPNPSAQPRHHRTTAVIVGVVLAILGAAILVIALSTSGSPDVEASPSSAPSGQVTYSHTSPAFRVDHPSSWTETSSAGVLIAFTTPLSEQSDMFSENVNILQQSLPAGTTLQEYTNLSLANAGSIVTDFHVVSSRTTTLSSLPAQELEYTGSVGAKSLHFFAEWTVVGTSAYVLTYTAEPASYQRYLAEAVAIIHSFRLG